ncbi:MAG: flagellar motor switch protein FliN [Spirochaetales bacterium]|nr:flagellar motor switch protein FliN [Spirochaetales bacterium]
MSDGSLTQDEIDALLSGDSDDSMVSPAASSPAPGGSGNGLNASELEVLSDLFKEVNEVQSASLSGIMVTTVTMGNASFDILDKESFFASLPDEIVEIKADFTEGFMGGHLFVLTPETTLKIAEPMMGQTDLELDATAISSVSEAISQITGAAVTKIGDRVGRSIMTESPQGQNEPKAMLTLPGDSFVRVTYTLSIEGQPQQTVYELFPVDMIKELASLMGASSPDPAAAMAQQMGMGQQQPMGGMNQPQMGGMNQMGMNQPQMGGMNQMGMNQQQMGGMNPQMMNPQMGMNQMGMNQQMGMNPQMMNMMGMQPTPNVQSVQFPDFAQNLSGSEQRNISLLMDVAMEMTVELGRAKWLIKDILGMGEGTIVELDKLAGEPVDVLVNNNLIAKGEVVVIDENFGVRVTEIVSGVDKMTEG